MSVVVSVNLADGVILGVDSAVTLPGPPPIAGQPLPPNMMHGGVLKVYEDAAKLFPLGNRPIGVATFGAAVLGNRTVGNYLRQFIVENPNRVVEGETTVQQIAEALRIFFADLYKTVVIPSVEKFQQKPFDQIPEQARPGYGFVVGGYSAKAYLSEVWMVIVPVQSAPQLIRAQGDFSYNWYALFEPIERYLKGYSRTLMQELLAYFETIRGAKFSSQENDAIVALLNKHEFVVPTVAMPIPVGIEYARFLVELVVNHHKYAIGAPVVGGRAKIGVVTYAGGPFGILD